SQQEIRFQPRLFRRDGLPPEIENDAPEEALVPVRVQERPVSRGLARPDTFLDPKPSGFLLRENRRKGPAQRIHGVLPCEAREDARCVTALACLGVRTRTRDRQDEAAPTVDRALSVLVKQEEEIVPHDPLNGR